jgi:hypothetical protein
MYEDSRIKLMEVNVMLKQYDVENTTQHPVSNIFVKDFTCFGEVKLFHPCPHPYIKIFYIISRGWKAVA